MAFRIEERFQVLAPVDRVWSYLVDPRQVVECLPGAELTEMQGDRAFTGKVKVKVGPVTAAYSGRAELTETNEVERVVRMSAQGREAGGAGSAKMRLTMRIATVNGGSTEVFVEAEVDIAGKIVQFGRGMIDTVSKQLFRQFVECARATLEGPVEDAGDGARSTSGPTAREPNALAAAADVSRATPPGMTPSVAAESWIGVEGGGPDAFRATPPEAALSGAPQRPGRSAKPIRLVPLLLSALWEWIKGLFGRRAAG